MCTSKLLVEEKKEKKTATRRRFQIKKALGGQCFIGKSRLEMLPNQSRVGAREEEDCVSRD
jgi:hypothetical protein